MKKIYCIGIGGIWVSALARYYLSQGYEVYGSDANHTALIDSLQSEGIDIIIGQDAGRINESFEKIIYSEAVPQIQEEREKARQLNIPSFKYNEALSEVANPHKLIAISGTHGKSTTTSLISLILKNSEENFYSIVGTLLKEFWGRNFYGSSNAPQNSYFSIEACEYKEHFLLYSPLVLVITNIEYDHADYFKSQESYSRAFEKMMERILPGGFVVYSLDDTNSQKLIGKRSDISYIWVSQEWYFYNNTLFPFPDIKLQIPGDHILLDAKLAYVVGHMIGISDESIVRTLREYTGVWRRMEIIGKTEHGNMLMSDYGHHPTEISVTLKALKEWYPEKKLYVVFQPHQYSRTLELLEGFQNCFSAADTLVIPNIYASRDTAEDMQKINVQSLIASIHHPNVYDGNGLENTLTRIENYDVQYPDSSIILLQGAGDVDTLRYKIKTR